jgi:hypothetical protein
MDATETSPSSIQTAEAPGSKDPIKPCLDLSRSAATSGTSQFADPSQRMTNANASATAQLCEACQKLFNHWYDVQDCDWDDTGNLRMKLTDHPFNEGARNGCSMCSLLQSRAANRTMECTKSVIHFRRLDKTHWSVLAGYSNPLHNMDILRSDCILCKVATLMQGM